MKNLAAVFVGPIPAAFAFLMLLSFGVQSYAQSISSGTVTGTVADPSGAVVSGAAVEIRNPITGYQQTTSTDANGSFRFNNVPFNNYRVTATRSGFNPAAQNI